jgi:hypothetical protein
MTLRLRRPRYSVVEWRTGRPVIGQARNKNHAYRLLRAFGPGLWVVRR